MTTGEFDRKTADCPDPEEIVAFLRDEISPEEESRFRMHLNQCVSCRKTADDFGKTISHIAQLYQPVESVDLTDEIFRSIPSEEWNPGKRTSGFFAKINTPLFRIAAGFLFCMGITAVGFGLLYILKSNAAPADSQIASAILDQSLEWLLLTQDKSGKWNPAEWGGREEYTIGLSAMALLSMIRNPDFSGQNPSAIRNAIQYLIGQQTKNGLFGQEFSGKMYNHGIAATALLEAYTLMKDPVMENPIHQALSYIQSQQLSSGGWGYWNIPGGQANTSISVWQLHALLRAHQLGWNNQESVLTKGMGWLAAQVNDQGQVGYSHANDFPMGHETLTAMGADCFMSAAGSSIPFDTELLHRVKATVLETRLEEERPIDFYGLYFQASALSSVKTQNSLMVLESLKETLIDQYIATGPLAGTWNPHDQWGTVGGRIYSTSMAALTLEM